MFKITFHLSEIEITFKMKGNTLFHSKYYFYCKMTNLSLKYTTKVIKRNNKLFSIYFFWCIICNISKTCNMRCLNVVNKNIIA